jgi:hypothetical protein
LFAWGQPPSCSVPWGARKPAIRKPRAKRNVFMVRCMSSGRSPLLVINAPAHADSDGSYCTGKGYIAFDLRSFMTPTLKIPHVLRVFRFESERGIYKAGEAPMADFQVHSMTCTSDRVEVSGFAKVYVRYIIGITGEADSVRVIENPEDEGTSKGPEITRKAELLQIDSGQKVSQRVLLYEYRKAEDGD